MTDDQPDTFITDAGNGDMERVKAALRLGVPAATKNFALIWAAKGGHNDIVTLLLNEGADIHAGNDLALTSTATEDQPATLELLIKAGADIHVDNDWPLRAAVRSRKEKNALVLLRHGCDPYKKCLDGDFAGSDAFDSTRLAQWLEALRHSLPGQFAAPPLRAQCFAGDGQLQERVLDACVTGEFTHLIGAPLLASGPRERQLLQDIWDALPSHWQDQNQNIYVALMKAGETRPIVGAHTAGRQHSHTTPGRRMTS